MLAHRRLVEVAAYDEPGTGREGGVPLFPRRLSRFVGLPVRR
jgi:hypothetical protein